MILSEVPGYDRCLQRGYRLEESFREFSYLDAPEFICGVEVRPLTLQMYLQLCDARSPFLVGGRAPFIQDVGVFLFRLSPAYDAAHAAKAEARTKVSKAATLSYRELRAIARENGLLSADFKGPCDPHRFLTLKKICAHLRNLRRKNLTSLLEQNVELISRNAFKRVQRRFIANILHLRFATVERAIRRFTARMLFDKPPQSKRKNLSLDPSDTSAAADVIHIIAGAYDWSRDEILRLPMPEVFQALRNIQRDQPKCPKRARAKVHPLATRFTARHRAIANAAAEKLAAARESAPCS
jgi:hypothetical protein